MYMCVYFFYIIRVNLAACEYENAARLDFPMFARVIFYASSFFIGFLYPEMEIILYPAIYFVS